MNNFWLDHCKTFPARVSFCHHWPPLHFEDLLPGQPNPVLPCHSLGFLGLKVIEISIDVSKNSGSLVVGTFLFKCD